MGDKGDEDKQTDAPGRAPGGETGLRPRMNNQEPRESGTGAASRAGLGWGLGARTPSSVPCAVSGPGAVLVDGALGAHGGRSAHLAPPHSDDRAVPSFLQPPPDATSIPSMVSDSAVPGSLFAGAHGVFVETGVPCLVPAPGDALTVPEPSGPEGHPPRLHLSFMNLPTSPI